ncbi:MAG: hypothetical protein M9908_04550 [Phyllobacteriaceae bacterium]|nr:hypothetical protein [Phyllobacteriaceae bacterium]
MSLAPAQILMILGIVIAFGGYFALEFHRHKKGRGLIAARDKRLYPANFEQLSAADRKQLYRNHSWAEAWDMTGKVYAGATVFGLVALGAAVVLYLVERGQA